MARFPPHHPPFQTLTPLPLKISRLSFLVCLPFTCSHSSLKSSLLKLAMVKPWSQNSRDVWCALEAAYSHDSVERVHTLRDSLRHLQKGSSIVAEFSRKFKAVCDPLTAIGHPLDETDKTHWFLCGLGLPSIPQLLLAPLGAVVTTTTVMVLLGVVVMVVVVVDVLLLVNYVIPVAIMQLNAMTCNLFVRRPPVLDANLAQAFQAQCHV
ncbi:zinc finger, CCHC-type containing LTR copia-type gag-polypeptide [Tanacetum coccineum]